MTTSKVMIILAILYLITAIFSKDCNFWLITATIWTIGSIIIYFLENIYDKILESNKNA